MNSLTFQELDKRGQEFAVKNYGETQIVEEMAAELLDSCDNDRTFRNLFSLLGWRFTEHGERVA